MCSSATETAADARWTALYSLVLSCYSFGLWPRILNHSAEQLQLCPHYPYFDWHDAENVCISEALARCRKRVHLGMHNYNRFLAIPASKLLTANYQAAAS